MIRVNVVGTLTLADVTNERGIHLTVYATGCIFHYDKDFPQDSGIGFKEDDTPNFFGSFYSKTKAHVRPRWASVLISISSLPELTPACLHLSLSLKPTSFCTPYP